jgi:ubiquinone/menaquinone biosynthesis C-methylase UbiE
MCLFSSELLAHTLTCWSVQYYQMVNDPTTVELEKMRQEWDERARENARHYVATAKEQWNDEEYFRSGEINVEREILTDMGNVCQGADPKQMRVLEIGCGTGRITRALAKIFGEVYAVDISGEMIRQAQQALRDYPNAHALQNNGCDLDVVRDALGGNLLDFAFSYIVFQHIPNRDVIEKYVRETQRLLKPGALFKVQVQGYMLDEGSPRNSWLGASFTEEQAREMAERCGFEMRYNHGAGDQYYWLWYFKKPEA